MIAIEPLAPDHFPLVAGWLAEPSINQWLTAEWRGRSVEPAVVAIAVRNRRNRLFLVRDEGVPRGIVGLADLEPDDRCAMVWYVLGDQASGRKGIISAAVGQLCRHAFDSLGLSCVYAWIMRPNAASRRVLEKNGFRESGTLRRAAILRGEPVDRVYFDLTPQDLAPPRP